MRIRKVELFGLRIPYKLPIKMAWGGRTHGDFLLVRLEADTGEYGIGSSGALTPRLSGENLTGAMEVIEGHIAPDVLLGEDPANINKINRLMDTLFHGHTLSKSPIDFALYDLLGRHYGVPVYQLLGGAQRDEIPLEWIVQLGTPEEMAQESRRFLDRGFQGLKIKFSGDPQMDIARLKVVREEVGTDTPLCIDMNGGYTTALAIQVINEIEPYRLKFIEQPVARNDIEGMRRIRVQTPIPLAADEGAWSVEDALNLIKNEAVDYLHAAPSRIGGFTKSRQYLSIAEAAHITCIYSIYNGPVPEYAASCHFAFAAPPKPFPDEVVGVLNLHGGYDSDEITDSITKSCNPRLKNGRILLPEGPGFGLELDEANIKRFLVAHKVITG